MTDQSDKKGKARKHTPVKRVTQPKPEPKQEETPGLPPGYGALFFCTNRMCRCTSYSTQTPGLLTTLMADNQKCPSCSVPGVAMGEGATAPEVKTEMAAPRKPGLAELYGGGPEKIQEMWEDLKMEVNDVRVKRATQGNHDQGNHIHINLNSTEAELFNKMQSKSSQRRGRYII